MMMPDPKKAIMTIMAKRHPDGSRSAAPMKEERSMSEEGEMDPRHAAAQDVMMAMHEKSPERLMQAMGNFHDLHMAHMSKGDGQDA